MPHALFIAGTVPTADIAAREHLRKFLATVNGGPTTTSPTAMLSEGVWLFDLGSELPTFAALVAAAQQWGVQTHTLFFDQKPAFVVMPAAP